MKAATWHIWRHRSISVLLATESRRSEYSRSSVSRWRNESGSLKATWWKNTERTQNGFRVSTIGLHAEHTQCTDWYLIKYWVNVYHTLLKVYGNSGALTEIESQPKIHPPMGLLIMCFVELTYFHAYISYYYYYFIRTQSTLNTISTFHKNQQIVTSNGEKEKMIESNELKSATIFCLKGRGQAFSSHGSLRFFPWRRHCTERLTTAFNWFTMILH